MHLTVSVGRRNLPLALLCVACGFLFYDLGYTGLTSPDEARYSEIAREMLTGSGWVVPLLNGEPRVNKPPLTYWALAFSYRLFGLKEWAGRLVPALAALCAVFLTVAWGTRATGRTAGLMAGVATASSVFFLIVARLTITDMLLCFWFTGAVVSGLWALSGARRNPLPVIAFFVFAAGGTLTKGPVALMLPGLIVLGACAWEKRWRSVHWPAFGFGAILYFLLSAPWFVLLERALPGAARGFLLAENFDRFAKGVDHTGASVFYYVPIILFGVLPWTTMAPGTFWRDARQSASSTLAQQERFFVRSATLWWFLPFVFFTASATKLATYVLPCFPAMGLLLGRALAQQMETDQSGSVRRRSWITSQGVLLAVLTVAGSVALVRETNLPERQVTALSIWILTAGVVGGTVAIATARRWGTTVGVPILLIAHLLFIAGVMHAHATLEPFEEMRPVALQLRALGEPTSALLCYGRYEPAMSFYLRRLIPTVKGDELEQLLLREKRILCIIGRNHETEVTSRGWKTRRLAGNDDCSVLEIVANPPPSALLRPDLRARSIAGKEFLRRDGPTRFP